MRVFRGLRNVQSPDGIFQGRRALESYTLLFLHECITRPSSSTTKSLPLPSTPFDIDLLTYRALKTHILGEFVGTRWQLDKAMLWIPVRRKGKEEEKNIGGLYKVMGTTVEAIMGGIFHHYVSLALLRPSTILN